MAKINVVLPLTPYPIGGYSDTTGGLEDRNASPTPTEVENAGLYGCRGASHHDRTLVPDPAVTSVRAPTVEDGVSFVRPLRCDLDDDQRY